MTRLLSIVAVIVVIIATACIAIEAKAATPPATTNQGGTGVSNVSAGSILFGSLFNIRMATSSALQFNAAASRLSATYASTTGFSSDYASTTRFGFGGVTGTAWSDFCVSITGSAGLCDGNDASGAGGSAFEIATATDIAVPNLAYFTQTSGRTTLGSVSTTTHTITGPFNISATPVVLGASPITTAYWGLATSSALTSSHLLYSTNGAAGVQGVATSSGSCTGNISCSAFVVVGSGAPSIAFTGDLPFANLTQGAANTVLVNQTSGTADFAALATSTFANGLYTGTAGQMLARLSNGTWAGVATTTAGTGLTYDGTSFNVTLGTNITPSELSGAPTANQIAYVNSAGTAFVGVATSSLNLGVSGGGTGVTTLTGLAKGNGTGAFTVGADGTDFTLVDAVSCTNQVVTALTAAGVGTCSSINNAHWSGTDLSVANGGTGLSTFGGVNTLLYTTAADTLSSNASFVFDPGRSAHGIGTATPRYSLQIASSTGPQIALSGTSLITDRWTLRGADSGFYIATASPSTFATSSVAALSILNGGIGGLFGFGTSSPFANVSIAASNGVWPLAVGSTTKTIFAVTGFGGYILNEMRPATTTTITLDWSRTGPAVTYQIGASATTISLINATTSLQAGSRKLVSVCNPGSTASTITWSGVLWAGGTAPTQTTTANKCDVYSFFVGSATSTTAFTVFGSQTPNF